MKTLKEILKRFFPTPFLKEAFLWYNKVRISTIDRILFPEHKMDPGHFAVYRNAYPFREARISVEDLPTGETNSYFRKWDSWTQEEFLLLFDQKCSIEPDHGWAIIEPNRLLYYSLGVSRTLFQKKPSLIKFLRKRNVQKIERVISLRDTGEENYFHFYNDVLGKLQFLLLHGIEVDKLPVVVSKKLWEKEYFQYYLKHSALAQSLNWIIQDRQYVESDSAIFCKPLTHRKDLWDKILSPLRIYGTGVARIFLTRSKARLRFVENIDELSVISQKFGFTLVDTDNISPEEQRKIFSDAGFVVGVHGAGLTNMAFRTSTCRVLELFPPPDLGYLPFHYMMLARMLGFHYDAIIGDPGRARYSGGFQMRPDKFEKALSRLCDGS